MSNPIENPVADDSGTPNPVEGQPAAPAAPAADAAEKPAPAVPAATGSQPAAAGTPAPAPGNDVQPSPFDWRIIVLAVYLLVLLLLSANWLGGLMLADTSGTDENGKSVTSCKQFAKAESKDKADGAGKTGNTASAANTANTNAAGGNTNSNTANSAANPGGGSNAAAVNAANANRVNTNRPVNAPTATPAVNNAAGGNNETNTEADKTEKPEEKAGQTELPKVVIVSDSGLFGYQSLSVRAFINGGCLTADGYLFFVVLFAGMMGAIIRAFVSLYWHMGKKDFSFNWIWYYIFQPFFGATLGLVFYMVIRGGFSGGAVGRGNVFAFAAVGALTGLFSDNALAKLRQVAEALLVQTPSKTRDMKSTDESNPPVVKPQPEKPAEPVKPGEPVKPDEPEEPRDGED
jgi:hypothetical protein